MSTTLASLRAAVKLYRTTWSPDELERVLAEERSSVADALGIAEDDLPSEAATFAARFDTIEKKRKGAACDDARTVADRLARELGDTAIARGDGIHLDPRKLTELSSARGFDEIVFVRDGVVGVLTRATLASVMRELRRTTVESVLLRGASRLDLAYGTPGSRGRIALLLAPRSRRSTWVHVFLDGARALAEAS